MTWWKSTQEEISIPLLQFYSIILIAGLTGLIAILYTTLLSPKLWKRRQATWVNFCIAWIVYSLSFSLLAWAGQQTGPAPDPKLCITQGALVAAAITYTSTASVALVVQLYFNLTSIIRPPTFEKTRNRAIALLSIPLLIYFSIFVHALLVGISNPKQVFRANNNTHCHINGGFVLIISSGIVALATVIAIIFEVVIAVFLYRNWAKFRSSGSQSSFNLSMISRAVLFTAFSITSFVMSFVAISGNNSSIAPTISLAIIPITVVLAFGTQRDIIDTWMFWKKSPPKGHARNMSNGSALSF